MGMCECVWTHFQAGQRAYLLACPQLPVPDGVAAARGPVADAVPGGYEAAALGVGVGGDSVGERGLVRLDVRSLPHAGRISRRAMGGTWVGAHGWPSIWVIQAGLGSPITHIRTPWGLNG